MDGDRDLVLADHAYADARRAAEDLSARFPQKPEAVRRHLRRATASLLRYSVALVRAEHERFG